MTCEACQTAPQRCPSCYGRVVVRGGAVVCDDCGVVLA